jgi:S-methylmethionine-dependent homocysteine/selenocysteine methylase
MAISANAPTGPAWLHARIRAGATVLLDGGTGTELERRGVPMNEKGWCGDAMFGHADVLRDIHEDYIRAGADVIITNTFATARHTLEPIGLGADVQRANRLAVEIACEARERAATHDVAVAGSVSDFITDRNDRKWLSDARLRATYGEQTEILAQAGVDLLALEMMQEPEIAVPAIEAAVATGLPVWVGCSCRRAPDDGRLVLFDYPQRDFRELLDAILALPVGVIGIMHTEVPHVIHGIEMVRERWSGPMAAYPECGYFTLPNWHFVDIISCDDLVEEARDWQDKGVQIIGGCCGIGPEHIAALDAAFDRPAR